MKTKKKYNPTIKKKGRRRNLTMKISKSKYKLLLKQRKSKKKMSLKNKQLLDDALYLKYCKCISKLAYGKKLGYKAYPICMNSIYKQRELKPPKNASRKCNNIFNKNI